MADIQCIMLNKSGLVLTKLSAYLSLAFRGGQLNYTINIRTIDRSIRLY